MISKLSMWLNPKQYPQIHVFPVAELKWHLHTWHRLRKGPLAEKHTPLSIEYPPYDDMMSLDRTWMRPAVRDHAQSRHTLDPLSAKTKDGFDLSLTAEDMVEFASMMLAPLHLDQHVQVRTPKP